MSYLLQRFLGKSQLHDEVVVRQPPIVKMAGVLAFLRVERECVCPEEDSIRVRDTKITVRFDFFRCQVIEFPEEHANTGVDMDIGIFVE